MIKLILGRRELGKSTLACHFAQQMSPRLTIDPRSQFSAARALIVADVDPEMVLYALEQREDVIAQPRDRQGAVDALAWSAERFIMDGPPTRQLVVTFDEAGLYDVASWDYLLRCSPRGRTNFLFTAHRPKDISTTIRSIADEWFIFRTIQEHDLAVIEERCGWLVRDLVQTLQPFEYVVWNDAKSEARINRQPDAWFTPLEINA